ncbi:hypothetical protein [Frankia sp. EAN1pec]|uniref:hypothetical protein n=1 Tax=Parafrankia sp. (strain EAN1pec) TaxID=298653 RepID=UPI00059DCBD6
MLRLLVGPVEAVPPRAEGRAGRGDGGHHRVLGEDGDPVTAFDEPPREAELWSYGAATVSEGEQVRVAHR